MVLRRTLVAAPLAVSVAMLAHLLGFGQSHAPGGGHGAELLVATACGLGLLALSVIATAALGGKPPRRSGPPEPLASWWLGAALFAGGLATFAAIEFAEGHSPVVGWAPAAVAMAACLVAALGHVVRGWLLRAGWALADRLAPRRRTAEVSAPLPAPRSPLSGAAWAAAASRGRAPPRFA